MGPTRTGILAPAKPALQLLTRQLHDGGPAVNVVGRKVGGEEAEEQLAHFPLLQPFAGFHRGAAGVGGGETFQPVGPPAEAPPREVGHHLAETGFGVEARVRSRDGMDHDRAATKCIDLEAHPPELFPMALDRVELLVRQLHRERKQEALGGGPDAAELAQHRFIETRSWAECWSTMMMPSGP